MTLRASCTQLLSEAVVLGAGVPADKTDILNYFGFRSREIAAGRACCQCTAANLLEVFARMSFEHSFDRARKLSLRRWSYSDFSARGFLIDSPCGEILYQK